jgi:putative endonuclease
MKDARRSLGAAGERLAADFLAGQGYALLARNWRRGALGEIDLVAQDGACLVIVEVRTRRGRSFGTAEESVTPRKQARLVSLAEAYTAATGWTGPLRIDVVAIQLAANGSILRINHVQDAVHA